MAILSDPDRVAIWAEYMRTASHGGAPALSKTELRSAVNAIDQWVDDNAVAFNTAIPQPARGALTSKQKAALLMMIVEQRWKVS